MREVTGNLWTFPADYRCITTNGTVRKDGCAVMGRGCAREASIKFPKLQRELGEHIQRCGNIVGFWPTYKLFTLPVKHNWYEPADPLLIEQSVDVFQGHIRPALTYVLPRPGCGNGQLDWKKDVRSILLYLPDNVSVIHFG